MSRVTFPRFVPLPLNYLAEADLGRLTLMDFAVLSALSLEAKAAGKRGVVHTSAPAFATRWRHGVKATRAAFARLEGQGRLKRFHRQGARGNYWVAIDGFIVLGGGTALQLDADGTTDPENPKLVACDRRVAGAAAAAPTVGGSLPTTGSDRGSDGGSPHSLELESRDTPLPPIDAASAEPKRGGGGGEATATRLVGASRRTSDSVAQLVTLWRSLAATKGQVDECSYRDHAKTFAALLVVRGSDVEACMAVVRAYFADDDEFIVKSGWSIGVFAARMRGYSPAQKPSAVTPPQPPQLPQYAEPPASKEQAAEFADQIRRLFPNGWNTQ